MTIQIHNSSLESTLPVIVIGAGGHSKVLIDVLNRLDLNIEGLTDPTLDCGDIYCGIPVIGDDSEILKYKPDEVLLVNAIGSLPGKNHRFILSTKFRSLGYRFATIVDNASFVSSNVVLGEGVQILAGVVVQPGCHIGNDTILNTNSSVDHDCIIGDYCHIAPGVTLSGGITIGNSTHIGTGACVIQNIHIGFNSVIGAGCVVYKNLKDEIILKQSVQNIMTENKRVKK